MPSPALAPSHSGSPTSCLRPSGGHPGEGHPERTKTLPAIRQGWDPPRMLLAQAVGPHVGGRGGNQGSERLTPFLAPRARPEGAELRVTAAMTPSPPHHKSWGGGAGKSPGWEKPTVPGLRLHSHLETHPPVPSSLRLSELRFPTPDQPPYRVILALFPSMFLSSPPQSPRGKAPVVPTGLCQGPQTRS